MPLFSASPILRAMSTTAKRINTSLNLSSKLAVVAGGSQGIGAATARRLAQAGSSVIVVGRNETLLAQVVDDCKRVAKDGPSGKTFDYIKADLSMVTGINQAVRDIEKKSGGSVDYLVQTQGGPPNGQYKRHFGIEKHFATQILSRYTILSRLAEKGILKSSAVIVCAPGGAQTEFDVEDIELWSLENTGVFNRIPKWAARDGLIVDTFVKGLQAKYPHLDLYHIFPGHVSTRAAANQGFPFPIPQLLALMAPISTRTFGNTAESYAEIPVLLVANNSPEKEELVAQEGYHLQQHLKAVQTAPWANDPANQKKVIDKLESYLKNESYAQK